MYIKRGFMDLKLPDSLLIPAWRKGHRGFSREGGVRRGPVGEEGAGAGCVARRHQPSEEVASTKPRRRGCCSWRLGSAQASRVLLSGQQLGKTPSKSSIGVWIISALDRLVWEDPSGSASAQSAVSLLALFGLGHYLLFLFFLLLCLEGYGDISFPFH